MMINAALKTWLLKRDALGTVYVVSGGAGPAVVRDFGAARPGWRWLARLLGAREARALTRLDGVEGVPKLYRLERGRLVRGYIGGAPMHVAQPKSATYFRAAHQLLRRIHRLGVAHNDLAKEANWLCLPDGECAIVDFQVAFIAPRRGRWFRLLAREDLRHLLKHKRHYCPDRLTAREKRILASPSWTARLWRRVAKPTYRLVTRQMLGWTDRLTAEERNF